MDIYGKSRSMFGRRQIFVNEDITKDNVSEILEKVINDHDINCADIDYLWSYYKGKQPVLMRTKEVNSKVCNRVVVNLAREIVNFRDGYFIGKPVQYVARSEHTDNIDDVNELNTYMQLAGKAAADMELTNWFHVCGTSYRGIFPTGDIDNPFELFTLDPRNTFVIYKNDMGHTPLMAVTYTQDDANIRTFFCYTRTESYTVKERVVSDIKEHALPTLPIIEYPANPERMGAFEEVLTLLDAINLTESNRLDGLEQFIQAIMVFTNAKVDRAEFEEILDLGAVNIASSDGQKADVKYLTAELNQAQTQVLLDSQCAKVMEICGVPSRSGGASTSDTGTAVMLREGWEAAESRTKKTELMFDVNDKNTLKSILNILNANGLTTLKPRDVDIRFTRHNYDNLTVKVNALDIMLKNEQIANVDAWQLSGLAIDPEAACLRGQAQQPQRTEINSEVQTQLEDGGN